MGSSTSSGGFLKIRPGKLLHLPLPSLKYNCLRMERCRLPLLGNRLHRQSHQRLMPNRLPLRWIQHQSPEGRPVERLALLEGGRHGCDSCALHEALNDGREDHQRGDREKRDSDYKLNHGFLLYRKGFWLTSMYPAIVAQNSPICQVANRMPEFCHCEPACRQAGAVKSWLRQISRSETILH